MKINIVEITISTKKPGEKAHENILAEATITLKEESGDYLTITGFRIWKSKFGGLNVTGPGKQSFQYCCGTLMRKIKLAILEQYEYDIIPACGK